MTDKVRYLITGKCFVNGSLHEPRGKDPLFIMAAPGLAGPALKLAPEAAAPAVDERTLSLPTVKASNK